ncbi:MAG: Asp23/Gls24 family envelope stress response protein [Chloroflexi bacterium]|nr:Asp23/Gls24 family envelope stress response protein [Chloroflexota bacterium]
MPDEPASGRAVVTRRAVRDIVRAATLGSYGVTGFSGGAIDEFLARLGLASPGLRVAIAERLTIELDLSVAYGVPVAEVARQVDSAIRYRIRQALGREVDSLTIRVAGLVCPPGSLPEAPATRRSRRSTRSSDLAESGTDVA